ncbi:MAG: 30S ribosomal protein S12 methylthiotransferase RimO [Polyangiaceae bacterium]
MANRDESATGRTKKTIHFVSLGCVKNRVDSEVMVGVAKAQGYEVATEADDADVIVVNTCGFIGEAKKESIDTIFELAEMKKNGACSKLVVSGCLSQRYPEDLAREMPEVDHFLGSSDMLKLEDVLSGKADRMLVGNPADWVMRASDPRTVTQSRASAYVKIAEGCNRTCSFCVIPQLRGKQRSRSADDVVREAEALVAAGALEINLISQDTIAYGRDLPKAERHSLAELAERVADIRGLKWLRLFYLYPETMDDGLVELIAGHPNIVKYVDMPLQHAADTMLKRMRRGHGKDRQKRVVERMRKLIPDLTFRTAFIVGHPGETDEEFEELVDFVRWAEFEHVAAFKYSDEEECGAFAMDDKVSNLVASKRYRKIMALQRGIARKKNQTKIGRELEVLVEGASEEHEFVMKGRHAGQAPEIDGQVFLSGGDVSPGDMVKVEITQASDYDLVGEILGAVKLPKRPKPGKRVSLPMLGGKTSWQ